MDHEYDLMELDCAQNSSENLMISFLNHTDPLYFAYRGSYISILLTLAVCGTILNSSMIIFLVRRSTHRKRAMGCLVLQLLFADLLVSVFCLFVDGVWNATVEWKAGDFLCRLVKFLQMFSLYATTLILTGISVESCVTLSYPLTRANRTGTFLRVRLIGAMAWILAAIMSAPQAIIFHVERAPVCFDFHQCVTHGFYSHPVQELAYTMTTLAVMFMAPLLVIVFCHFLIARKITKEAKLLFQKFTFISSLNPIDDSSDASSSLPVHRVSTQGTRVYNRSRRLSLMMTSLTAAVFLLCWVPYYGTMIAQLFNWRVSHETLSVIFCFGMSYAVLNPIIFASFVFKRKNSSSIRESFTFRPNVL